MSPIKSSDHLIVYTGSTHTLGEGLHRTYTPEAGILEAILKFRLPQLGKDGNLGWIGVIATTGSVYELKDKTLAGEPGTTLKTYQELWGVEWGGF